MTIEPKQPVDVRSSSTTAWCKCGHMMWAITNWYHYRCPACQRELTISHSGDYREVWYIPEDSPAMVDLISQALHELGRTSYDGEDIDPRNWVDDEDIAKWLKERK